MGVPQGSTLGPLLFLLYVNDLINCTHVTPRLFADDTCLIANAISPVELSKALNFELENVYKWMSANKLCINAQKSKALIISPKPNNNNQNNNIILQYEHSKINITKTAKYLGVIIDDEIKFKPHIQLLKSKLSRALGMMYKVKSYLPKHILLQLYYAIFHPHLLYCAIVWSSTNKTYLDPIRKLQNRVVKLIDGLNYRQNSSHAFKRLNIVKFDDLVKIETGKFVHTHFKRKIPPTFNNFFTKLEKHHSINTRIQTSGNFYHIPRYKTSKLQRSIKYTGVKVWNSIPGDIKLSSIQKFKKLYKNFLTINY